MITTGNQRILDQFPGPRPLYLWGENLYEMEAALDVIKRRCAEIGVESVAIMHGEETSWGALLDEASTGSLFGDRLILVRHAEDIRDDRAGAQESLLRTPPEGVHLVFLSSDPDRKRKTTKNLESLCTVVACELPKPAGLPGWVTAFARERGYTMTRPAAELAVALFENDPLRIAMEIDKVLSYAGEKRAIDEDDVAACLSFSRDVKPWSVGDLLLSGDLEGALLSLKRMRDASEPPGRILFLVSRQIRKIHDIALLLSRRVPASTVRSVLSLSPYSAQRDMALAARLSPAGLADACSEILRTEALIKSSSVNDLVLLETMLHRIHQRLVRDRGARATSGAGRA